MLHTQLLAAAFALIALVVAGCGGTSEKTSSATTAAATGTTAVASTPTTTSSSTTTQDATTPASSGKALTRTVFVADANTICARVNAKRAASAIGTAKSFALLKGLAAEEKQGAAELAKLVPPAEMAHEWEKFIEEAEAVASYTAKYGEYSETKATRIPAAIRSMLALGSVDVQRMVAIAKHNHITQCAQTS